MSEGNSTSKSNVLKITNEVFFAEIVNYLNEGKSVLFNIKGNSMLPFLKDGETIKIAPLDLNRIKLGMIILSRSSYGIVLHRLVKKKKGAFWLAGDGNLIQHEVVHGHDIIGVTMCVIRDEKSVNLNYWFSNIMGLTWYYLRPFRLVFYKLFKVK